MRLAVSQHAFEKHLWFPEYYQDASVFFDERIMMSSIMTCLSNPDDYYTCKTRLFWKAI